MAAVVGAASQNIVSALGRIVGGRHRQTHQPGGQGLRLPAGADQLRSGRGQGQPTIGKVAGEGDGVLGIEAGDLGLRGVVHVVADDGKSSATADASEPAEQLVEAIAEVDGGQGGSAEAWHVYDAAAGTASPSQLADSAFEGPHLARIRVDQHHLVAGEQGRQVAVRAGDQHLAGGGQGDRHGLWLGRIEQQDLVAHFVLILGRPKERGHGGAIECSLKWGGRVGGSGGEAIGQLTGGLLNEVEHEAGETAVGGPGTGGGDEAGAQVGTEQRAEFGRAVGQAHELGFGLIHRAQNGGVRAAAVLHQHHRVTR